MRVKLPRSALGAYLLAGIVTWPVVTAAIYWADRITIGPPESGAGIGVWASGGCALAVSALIVLAGWLQSSHIV